MKEIMNRRLFMQTVATAIGAVVINTIVNVETMPTSKHPMLGKLMRLKFIPGITQSMFDASVGHIVPIIGFSDNGKAIRYFFEVKQELFKIDDKHIGWRIAEAKDEKDIIWNPDLSTNTKALYVTSACVDIIE